MSLRSNVMITIFGITLVVISGCKGKLNSGAPDSGVSSADGKSGVTHSTFAVGNWVSASGHITFDIRADGTLDFCGQDNNGVAVMKSCETGTWVSVPNETHQIALTSNRGTTIVKLDEYQHPEDIEKARTSALAADEERLAADHERNGWSLPDGSVVCPSYFKMTQILVFMAAQLGEVRDGALENTGCFRANNSKKVRIVNTMSYSGIPIAQITTQEPQDIDLNLYVLQKNLK